MAGGGVVYHPLNGANGWLRLFEKEDDCSAFEPMLKLAHEQTPARVLALAIRRDPVKCN